MTLLEINKALSGSCIGALKVPYKSASGLTDLVEEFYEGLSMDEGFFSRFQLTEQAKEFYKACPLMLKLMPKEVQEDVFYAAKSGFYFEGVPPKLTYLVTKAVKLYDTPNHAINMISDNSLKPFLRAGALGDGLTVKNVVEGIIGREYQVLSDAVRAVPYNGCYELYVENVDRVIVLPQEYGDYLNSREDLLTVQYVQGEGVYLCGMLLRVYNGKLGITKTEFDLRECV